MNSEYMDNQTQGKWSGLDTFIVFIAWLILSTETMFHAAGRVFNTVFSSSVMSDYIGAIAIHVVLLVIVRVVILSKHKIFWKYFGFRSLTKQHIKSLCLWSISGITRNDPFINVSPNIWCGKTFHPGE